jgi:hypothetical protein
MIGWQARTQGTDTKEDPDRLGKKGYGSEEKRN